ncbi:unnamed protein product [Prunus armeniaca]
MQNLSIVDLTDKLSKERTCHGAWMFEMMESMYSLKSSLGHKDDELKSLVATLLEHKEAYFTSNTRSKHEIVANAYKQGYLDCKNGFSPCCPIKDEDAELLYLDLSPAQSEQINVVDVEAVGEQMADEVVVEEDDTKGGTADEVRVDGEELAAETAQQMVVVE